MIIVIPLCSVFIIVGSWLCLKGIRICLKAHNSKEWNPTVCKIISSKIDETRDSDDDMFEAIVSYQYRHNGKKYTGYKIYFGYASSSAREDSEIIVKLFTEGKEATAYVNPIDPYEAVLIPGIQRFALVLPLWAFGF